MVENAAIDLDPEHSATVSALLARFVPGYEVRAYGSRVKWTAGFNSDLDLVVIGDEHMNPLQLLELREAFEESNLPFSVDILEWHSIADNFREEISRDHVVLQPCVHGDEWRDTTVGKFAPFVYGKSLPAHSRAAEGTVQVYGSNGVVGSHDTPLTGGPTVIVGRKGTVGAVRYSLEPCWPIDTTFYIEEDDPDLARFKYYALSALGLAEMNSDSAVPGLNRDAAHAREIRVPDEASQRRIGSVLGALDEKIDLNRQMCETLEEMARALFTAWFVDFEPVRAKVEGRWSEGEALPGLPAHLRTFFPDHLVESQVGSIPAGWRVAGLDEVADFTNGLALQRFPSRDDDYLPVIKIAEMRRGYTDRTDKCSASLDPKYVVDNGDLLFSWSGSLKVVLWSHGRGALNQHLFKVTSARFPLWFYWGWINEYLQQFQGIASGKATTMGHIRRHHLGDAKVCVPPFQSLDAIGELIAPMIQTAIRCAVQMSQVAILRDSLLSRLVSGEVRFALTDTVRTSTRNISPRVVA